MAIFLAGNKEKINALDIPEEKKKKEKKALQHMNEGTGRKILGGSRAPHNQET